MADRIEISIENHIAVMTIRRPEKLNAPRYTALAGTLYRL